MWLLPLRTHDKEISTALPPDGTSVPMFPTVDGPFEIVEPTSNPRAGTPANEVVATAEAATVAFVT